MPVQCCSQQRAGVERGRALVAVVTFLVYFARQLGDLLLLQRQCQGVQRVNPLEVRPCALRVFAHPVGQAGGRLQGGRGQGVLQRGLGVAAKVQGGRHKIQRAGFDAHGSTSPAARSMRHVRISGSPMSAVGSSLRMASSSAMPRPSLLALPAQS